jgi:hypothetical protein
VRKLAELRAHPVSFAQAMQEGLWRGVVKECYDGDTFDILLDKGHYDYAVRPYRMVGYDTWEMDGPDKTRGLLAKVFVESKILNQPVLIRSEMVLAGTHEKLSITRYLGYLWYFPFWPESLDRQSLAAFMLAHPEHLKM